MFMSFRQAVWKFKFLLIDLVFEWQFGQGQFRENLLRSGLISNAELAAWQAGLSPSETAATAVDALVRGQPTTGCGSSIIPSGSANSSVC